MLLEYQRLKLDCLVSDQIVPHNSYNVLAISLLNIRSLRKHCNDIKHDSRLFKSDILGFTETQLLPQESDNDIRHNLQPFMLHRQDHHADKYSSMAVLTRDTIEMPCYEYFSQINALKFDLIIKKSQLQQARTFLLLYRKQSTSIQQYINNLAHVLNTYAFDIVFGDFNINYLNDGDLEPLRILMESYSYNQVVNCPTFISGSLLDHVYVKPTSVDVLENTIINVYYSDHDAVKLVIKLLKKG